MENRRSKQAAQDMESKLRAISQAPDANLEYYAVFARAVDPALLGRVLLRRTEGPIGPARVPELVYLSMLVVTAYAQRSEWALAYLHWIDVQDLCEAYHRSPELSPRERRFLRREFHRSLRGTRLMLFRQSNGITQPEEDLPEAFWDLW